MATVPKSQKPVLLRPCVTHFSHDHPLRPFQVKAEEELVCSGCALDLSGSAFRCSKSNCQFFLHRSCFTLKPKILHKSHPDHHLTLLSSPPKTYANDRFICDACQDYGTAFVYHCSLCNYDLHIGCLSLPNTVEHIAHPQHPLILFYSPSCDRGITVFKCLVCEELVTKKNYWVYYCAECDYGVHVLCVNCKPSPKKFELESELQHKSHPQHPLKLLSSPPSNYSGRRFYCNGCGDKGIGFDYHCSACQFDLHIDCAFLPKTMKHADHPHQLTLYYSSSCDKGNATFSCDVCKKIVPKTRWVYYCTACNYGTHIRCLAPVW